MQEGLFINKPVYDYQSLDALLVHAYYTTKHLTAATEVGYNSAFYVQVGQCCAYHIWACIADQLRLVSDSLQILMICADVSRQAKRVRSNIMLSLPLTVPLLAASCLPGSSHVLCSC